MPLQPRSSQFEEDQADRLGKFLQRLAADDKLLVDYLNRRGEFLKEEVANGNLWVEDAALLLEGSYSRVKEVMSQGTAVGIIWVVPPWHI